MSPVKYHYEGFPPKSLIWDDLIPFLGPASGALAGFNALLKAIPNPDVLLSPLTTQEAVLSSQIEGTQATMAEVLEYEAGLERKIETKKKEDIQEILNYRRAILYAEDKIEKNILPISGRLIKETHSILLAGVRGTEKDPGNFRRTDNWIGKPGCTKEDATFIPIEPQHLLGGVSDWEKYLHSTQKDVLVQLAIVHAEFEALHPFYDGNGRIGRMLLPLFLYERKLLSKPTFYMSAYFEAHKDEYNERLLAISRDGDWTGWCLFFLKAMTEQADINTNRAGEILSLYNTKKEWMLKEIHSQYTIRAVDFLFDRPIFSSSDFINKSGITSKTARKILNFLKDEHQIKIIQEPSGRWAAIFAFPELLNVAEGKEVLKLD